MTKKGWIESLRLMAATAVIFTHVVSGIYGGADYRMGMLEISRGREILDLAFFRPLTVWAVPVFLMISGCLLLDPGKELTLRKIKAYIWRMMAVLLTFGLAFCLMESYISDPDCNVGSLVAVSFRNLIQGNSWGHMWYVYMMAGLYLFTPLLRSFLKTENAYAHQMVMTALFLFTILVPTLNHLWGWQIVNILPVSASYLFYYMLGYYLSKTEVHGKQIYMCMVTSFVLLCLSCLWKIENVEVVLNYENLFVMLFSSAIFLFARKAFWMERLGQKKWVQTLAGYSFCIYIIHPLFLNIFNKGFHVYPTMYPWVVGEVGFAAATLICSVFSASILKKIRWLKNII